MGLYSNLSLSNYGLNSGDGTSNAGTPLYTEFIALTQMANYYYLSNAMYAAGHHGFTVATKSVAFFWAGSGLNGLNTWIENGRGLGVRCSHSVLSLSNYGLNSGTYANADTTVLALEFSRNGFYYGIIFSGGDVGRLWSKRLHSNVYALGMLIASYSMSADGGLDRSMGFGVRCSIFVLTSFELRTKQRD